MDIGQISGSMSNNLITGPASQAAEAAGDDSFEKQLQAAVANNDDKALKSACQQFEAIMLDMLYKQMKATVPKSDLMPEDPGTDIFNSMLDDSLMDQVSKTGTFGLAESLYKQLSKNGGSTPKTDGGKAGKQP